MNEQEYLEKRVDDQIEWYGNRSKRNQTWYKVLSAIEIVSAAVIPFLAASGEAVAYNSVLTGGLGIIIAISRGIASLNKNHENWLTYRTTCETLKHEKYLFLAGAGPYQTQDPFKTLVERVESTISKENSQWAQITKQKAANKGVQPTAESGG